MKRNTALRALAEALREELGLAIRASKDAEDYATHDEARAESQWDTQGLESSYLAAGQAANAEEIAKAIRELEKLAESRPDPRDPIGVGSLFQCDWGDGADWYLIVPERGGTTAIVGKTEITAITPESPLGAAVSEKKCGDRVALSTGRVGVVRSVAS